MVCLRRAPVSFWHVCLDIPQPINQQTLQINSYIIGTATRTVPCFMVHKRAN